MTTLRSLLFITAIAIGALARAQQVSLEASVDRTQIAAGEQIRLAQPDHPERMVNHKMHRQCLFDCLLQQWQGVSDPRLGGGGAGY